MALCPWVRNLVGDYERVGCKDFPGVANALARVVARAAVIRGLTIPVGSSAGVRAGGPATAHGEDMSSSSRSLGPARCPRRTEASWSTRAKPMSAMASAIPARACLAS